MVKSVRELLVEEVKLDIFDVLVTRSNGLPRYISHVTKVEDSELGVHIDRYCFIKNKFVEDFFVNSTYEIQEFTYKKLVLDKELGKIKEVRLEDLDEQL